MTRYYRWKPESMLASRYSLVHESANRGETRTVSSFLFGLG